MKFYGKSAVFSLVTGLLFLSQLQAQVIPSAIRSQRVERSSTVRTSDVRVKRSRAVELDTTVFNEQVASRLERAATQAERHQRVRFPLFPDVEVTVDLNSVSRSVDRKTIMWSGAVEGTRYGQAAIAITGDIVSANISTDNGRLYQIRQRQGGTHVIQELSDEPSFPELEPVVVPNELEERQQDAPRDGSAALDDGNTVDVMVLYTASARSAAGGAAQMQNLIQLGVTETNQGYANSGITQRVRLVYSGEVTYSESGDFATDLGRLRNNNDGFLDEVHSLRDQYGADIVSLWVENGNACGIGYLMGSMYGSFAPNAFNVVMRSCATGYYSFGHEMGHNMGAQHDRANAGGQGLFPYSYGYQQVQQAPYFRTVMAYACSVNCARINYWSNPDVSYSGLPTGIPSSLANAADNRTTLNSSRANVVAFRPTVVSSSPGGTPTATLAISPASASVGYRATTGTIAVTITNGPLNWNASSNSQWLTITSGASGSASGTISYSVAANSASTSRTAAISVGNQTFTLTQAGAPAATPASLTAPAPGSTISTSSVTFTWSAGQNVSSYVLQVGTSAGQGNIYSNNVGTATSATVNNIPLNGSPLYMSLTTNGPTGALTPASYTFATSASNGPAQISSPAPNSTLPGAQATFTWNAAPGASYYWLQVGTNSGGSNVFGSSVVGTSATINNLPTSGQRVYVALWTLVGNSWTGPTSVQYTAANTGTGSSAQAAFTSPALGSTVTGSPISASWTPGWGALGYWVMAGSSPGATNYYSAWVGTATSAVIGNLPRNGTTVYLRIYTYTSQGYLQPVESSFISK